MNYKPSVRIQPDPFAFLIGFVAICALCAVAVNLLYFFAEGGKIC